MDVLLYGMKFRITSFGMIKPSPWVLFFPMYFVYWHKKPKQTFTFCNGTPTSIANVAKILLHFLLWKVCNMLKLNLYTCFFLFGERFDLNWFCLFALFYKRSFFLLAKPGISIWMTQIVLSLEVHFIYSF